MPVAQTNRDRLRGALLGPLGEEATGMLMQELDQSGLRSHVDERFDEQRRHVDERFDEQRRHVDERFDEQRRYVDERFAKVEERLDHLTHAIISLTLSIGESSRPANAVVYTVCGTFAVVAIATFLESVLGG